MAFSFVFPPIREYCLPNGLRTIWLTDTEQPVVEVLVQVPVGRFHDSQGFEGTAEVTANLIQKGPTSCTHEQFIDTMEQVGASNVLDVGEEQMIFGVRTLTKYADQIIPRFWEMISSPLLDEKEFRRIKREMTTALQAEFADPASLATRHFQAELYGLAIPQGRSASIQTVNRITLETVREFYRRYIHAAGSTIVIAGAESVDCMEQKWKPMFAQWRSENTVRGFQAPEIRAVNATRIRLIDKPDSSQTTLVLGHHAVPEKHPARDALALGNHILGGGNFSSRLMANVRSRTGKTYGIASQIASNRMNGTFLISTTTQSYQLADVIRAIKDVYSEVTTNGVTAEELEKAKQFASGNLAFQLEGIGNVAEKLLWLRFYGYDNRYIENHAAIIAAIDLHAVNSALKNILRSDGFVITAVGRRVEIQQQLEEFGAVSVIHFRAGA